MGKMHKRILAIVLCLALALTVVPASVFAGDDSLFVKTLKPGSIVPGELKVTLCNQYYTLDDEVYADLGDILPEIEIESYLDQYLCVLTEPQKLSIKEKDPEYASMIGRVFHIKLADKSYEAVERAIDVLKNNRFVKRVGPNYCAGFDTTPNDPNYAPTSGIPQWGLPKIGAPEAWDYITGSDATDGSELDDYVKVAVIDSGVDDQHPDLVNNLDMSLAYNAYDNIAGYTDDNYGHGTHVAGIIGAVGNNQTGVSGVCWNVEMVPIKLENSNNSPSAASLERAINYARDNDIFIANVSVSISLFDDDVISAVRGYSNYGGLLIKSAGNNYSDIDGNTAYQELSGIQGVIIVGALAYDMTDDTKAYFSNYGDEVVDLFAPGESILSTYIGNTPYEYLDGTSMAAPFVTGAAALIKSANTSYTGTSIKKRILDNVTTSTNLSGFCATGGRLNIPDALYDMGYQVIISNTMTHGTVRPSAIFTKPNTIVYLTAYPDAGYMLKPGTMKHNSNNTVQISKWRCFCAMPYSNDTITAQFYMVGDIDFDEDITMFDCLMALRHYAGQITLTGDALLAADVDGDGDVDNADAQYIADYVGGMISVFPIEL
ncbi:MAG: S8 family serine peptidase [Clostridia bacterium]|nr:S8 family serine peptidase [Clostridia bacterium]